MNQIDSFRLHIFPENFYLKHGVFLALSYYNLREVTVAGVHLVIISTSKITLLLKIIYMLANFLIFIKHFAI